MNVEARTEAAQFLFGEYKNRIFFAVQFLLGSIFDSKIQSLHAYKPVNHFNWLFRNGCEKEARCEFPYSYQQEQVLLLLLENFFLHCGLFH